MIHCLGLGACEDAGSRSGRSFLKAPIERALDYLTFSIYSILIYQNLSMYLGIFESVELAS